MAIKYEIEFTVDPLNLSQRLGALSRELRKDRDVSQQTLAEAVGTAQTKVSLLEHGKLDFSALAFVARIADYHGLSPVELLASAFEEIEHGVSRGRPDRPWLVSASRVLSRLAGRSDAADLLDMPQRAGLAKLPLDRLVMRLVRARAFGMGASGEPSAWLLPFAPALVRRAIDDLDSLEGEGGLRPGVREQVETEMQRFALVHEMSTRPADALVLVEALVAEYPVPELEYLRGVLLHRLGESPLRVKGAVHRALDLLEREAEGELRADLALSGLLEYLAVAAEAVDRPAYYLRDDSRVEHAIVLLRLAGFAQGGVHVTVRFAAMRHERLRTVSASDRDEIWHTSWREVAGALENARGEYEALALPMGVTYAEDWLARHDELAGRLEEALARIETVAAEYRRLGRRRWQCSAEIRAAFYRAGLASSEESPERALALAERTCERLGALLAEGPLPVHERPMVEEHLARAQARVVILRMQRGDPESALAECIETYRRHRAAALEHYDVDVDAAAQRLEAARVNFEELEAVQPALGGRE